MHQGECIKVVSGKYRGMYGHFCCWVEPHHLSSKQRAQIRLQTGCGWITLLINEGNFVKKWGILNMLNLNPNFFEVGDILQMDNYPDVLHVVRGVYEDEYGNIEYQIKGNLPFYMAQNEVLDKYTLYKEAN